jgi:hypothetical protein
MNQVALATARGRPAALSLRASAPKLSAGNSLLELIELIGISALWANVVTIDELREL